MWDELHPLCNNFCWSKAVAENIMKSVLEQKEWPEMTDAEKRSWAPALGRHVIADMARPSLFELLEFVANCFCGASICTYRHI